MSWKRLLAVFTVSGLFLAPGLALFAFRGAWAQTETPEEPAETAPADQDECFGVEIGTTRDVPISTPKSTSFALPRRQAGPGTGLFMI